MKATPESGWPGSARAGVGAAEIRDAVYEISEAASTVQDLATFYRRVHQIVATLMPARNFYIALLDKTGTQISMPYFEDERDMKPGPEFRPLCNGLTEYIIRTKKPFFFGPGEQEEFRERGEFDILGEASIVWMGAPLPVGDAVIGMLAVQSYSENDRYTKADLDVLSYVSRQVASAIHRKRTLALLAETNRKLDTLVNNLPGIVYRGAYDPAGTVEFISDGTLALTGYPASDFIGNRVRSFPSIIEPEDRDRVQREIEAGVTERRPYSISYRIRAADGAIRWVFDRGSAVFDGERVVALEGFIADVTEARRAEAERSSLAEQLRQAQKMESVGLLAGGVAHDLNNLLMPIMGYVDLLRESAPAGSDTRDMLQEIGQAAGRARDLVRQLLAFSRRQVLELRTVDLAEVLRDFHKILRATIREDIAIELALPPFPLAVRADPVQIEQVLLNLAVNAQDAMSPEAASASPAGQGGGSRGAPQAPRSPLLHISLAEATEGVVLTVRDTGVGMSEETLRHAFEPFYTTKAAGKGTGLGLSTAYGIVTQHGGRISVSSWPGQGTEFCIVLPRAPDARANPSPRPREAAASGGSETVLLVEDEPSVRELSRRMLNREGYTVIACANGDEALSRAREPGQAIDILVTDVIMAGLNGRELSAALLRDRPRLPVLFTSGYTDDVIARHGVLEDGVAFLAKPYAPRDLSARIRAMLDAPRRAG